MTLDDVAQERDFRLDDVLDGLPRLRVRQEADEVAGMAGAQRDADLAIGLEAADARSVAGARIDDDEGALQRVDRDSLGRHDAHQLVIDRARQCASVHQHLGFEAEHAGLGLHDVLEVLVAAMAHDVEEQHAALEGVAPVVDGRTREGDRVHERQHRHGRGRYRRIHSDSMSCRGARKRHRRGSRIGKNGYQDLPSGADLHHCHVRVFCRETSGAGRHAVRGHGDQVFDSPPCRSCRSRRGIPARRRVVAERAQHAARDEPGNRDCAPRASSCTGATPGSRPRRLSAATRPAAYRRSARSSSPGSAAASRRSRRAARASRCRRRGGSAGSRCAPCR